MSGDIVKALRAEARYVEENDDPMEAALLLTAADEIERLRKQRDHIISDAGPDSCAAIAQENERLRQKYRTLQEAAWKACGSDFNENLEDVQDALNELAQVANDLEVD